MDKLLWTQPDTVRQNEVLRDVLNNRVANISGAYGTAAMNLNVHPTDGAHDNGGIWYYDGACKFRRLTADTLRRFVKCCVEWR